MSQTLNLNHNSNVTKKDGSTETHSPMRCQHPDPDFSHPYCPIHIHVYSSNLTSERPSCLIADSAQSELLRT
jgi:hypothetical protein